MKGNRYAQNNPRPRLGSAGFSLLELVVAMSIFLIVGGAAINLFSRHEALLSQEQGIAGLNIGLRNALAQIQIDVVNAGYGLILGANVPSWPVGVTIVNSNPTTSQCNPTATIPATYAAACFDQLNVMMVDANTPALQPSNSCSSPLNTSSATTVSGVPVSGYYAKNFYSNFQLGDHVLFVTAAGSLFTTATLTAAATCPSCTSTSGDVSLSFTSTLAGGANNVSNDPNLMTVGSVVSTNGTAVTWVSGNTFSPAWAGAEVQINNADYTVSTVVSTTSLTLSSSAGTQSSVPFYPAATLSSSFCSTDYILRLQPIQYSVSVTNSTDPQLVRTQGGVSNVVMDQVIGFKVGAAWWDNNTSTYDYCYNTGSYCDSADTIPGYAGNFSLIRGVRATIIGRTTPSTDPTYTYRNPFDGGAYQIRGSSIIVDPRNLTMNND